MNARNFSFGSSRIPGFAEERLTDSMVNMNFMTRGRSLIWLVLAVLAFPISCNRRTARPEPPHVVQSKRANSAETMTGRVVRIADGDYDSRCDEHAASHSPARHRRAGIASSFRHSIKE